MNKRLTSDMADANGLQRAIRPTGFFNGQHSFPSLKLTFLFHLKLHEVKPISHLWLKEKKEQNNVWLEPEAFAS